MSEIRWKALKNYCLIDVNTTGVKNSSRILEIGCIKVRNDEIVDTIYTKIHPIFRNKALIEQYKDYEQYPTFKEYLPTLLKFIGRSNLVGWCVSFDMYHMEYDGEFEFKNNFVDVFDPYKRRYKEYYCSLPFVYEMEFTKEGRNFVEYDFDSVIDKCKATKQLYDSIKDYNKFIYKEMPTYDYIEMGDHVIWLKDFKGFIAKYDPENDKKVEKTIDNYIKSVQ